MQPENRREYRHIEAELRNQDPLATVEYGLGTEQTDTVRQDIDRIDQILDTDKTLSYTEKQQLYDMGVNLRLDWMYSEQGGKNLDFPRFEAEAKAATEFFVKAKQHADERKDQDPTIGWEVQSKWFDLEAYRAHRYLKESETTFQGLPEAAKAREAANLKMEKVLRASAAMMREMEPIAHAEGELGSDTRGLLYEHMITTYARYQTFADENFDEVFVRTALSREDRPWNGHVSPKRSFDIVVESPEGTRLLQAKNYDNADEYAKPIEKVKDTAFGRTLHDMRDYVRDFNILVTNAGDEKVRERTQMAGNRLDNVFGKQLAEASVR
jgi:hypothetical protein